MMKPLGKHAVAALTVVALGDVSVGAVEAHARPIGFSAAYTCRVPMLGARSVTIDGTLAASPSRPTTGTPTRFRLRISSPSLRAPVAIHSWTATARIDVTGAQTASFQLAGSGGAVPAHQPISAGLTGGWTPKVRGAHQLRGGDVTVTANISRLRNVAAPCTPRHPRPVLATLVVASPHRARR